MANITETSIEEQTTDTSVDEPAIPTTDGWKDQALSAEAVCSALTYAMYRDNELIGIEPGNPVPGSIIADGLVNSYCLHPTRLEEIRETFCSWIDQIPEPFSIPEDGGWSFLQLAIDRDGAQWAEHITCEQLIIVGLGLGCCQYVINRPEWDKLPHSAPYLMFSKDPETLKGFPMTIAAYAKLYSQETDGKQAH